MTILDIRTMPSPEERARDLAKLIAPPLRLDAVTQELVELVKSEHRRTCDRMRARVELALGALQRQSDGHFNRGLEAGRAELLTILRWVETEMTR